MINSTVAPPIKEALDITREFPAKLKRLRTLLGFTQQEMAEDIGVSQRVISYWEKGVEFPSDVSIFLLVILWLQELEAS
jgi:transcriptional regulator with XRE-family HTH domain